jgi:poly(3-hydroxybutyrate) depolymerase
VIVWPNGVNRSWNAADCCGAAHARGVDDVGFLRALVARLSSEFPIDPTRVYVSGWSNGCMMAQRLAVEASDLIAAVGCMAGYLPLAELAASARLRAAMRAAESQAFPVSVLEVHCMDDSQVSEWLAQPWTVSRAYATAAAAGRCAGSLGRPFSHDGRNGGPIRRCAPRSQLATCAR